MIRGLLLLGLILVSNAVACVAEEKAAEPSVELLAFAQQLVKIVEKQDRQAFADLIDWEQILEQSVYSKFEFVSPAAKKEFDAGFLRASRNIERPFYKKYLPDNNLVTLVHVKSLNDQSVQIFLRYYLKGHSQMLDYRVSRRANKSYKIIDLGQGSPVCSIASAMEFSGLIAHRFKYVKSMGPLESLRDWLTQHNDLFADFGLAVSTDDYLTVLKLFPRLAKEIQEMPVVEYAYYRANASVEKPLIKISQLRTYYEKGPDSGKLDLIRAYAMSQGDLNAALKTYDELDQLLAVDPLLNLHRAELLTELNKYDQAYECAKKLISAFPTWQRSHIMLMIVSLFDKNYKLTLNQLQLLRDQFQLDLVELIDTDDDYKDFRKSPEYAVWKKENEAAAGKEKQ